MTKQSKVIADAQGVKTGSRDKQTLKIQWDEVYTVCLYKIDMVTSIASFVVFDFSWGEFVEIHDEMEGFAEFVAALPKYLPLGEVDVAKELALMEPKDGVKTIYQQTTSQV